MLKITDKITLDDGEIQLEFIRASGPGGQNVNKVSSAVHLRFDAAGCSELSDVVYKRLKKIAGRRMTAKGILVIKANRYRTQEKNRQDAINRLAAFIHKALEEPKHRRPTKPTTASGKRRLSNKRRRAEIKRRRQSIRDGGEAY